MNNNDFANAEVLPANPGAGFNDFDFTVCSDHEAGEPGPFSVDNGVWWSWTPSATGTATISTEDNGTQPDDVRHDAGRLHRQLPADPADRVASDDDSGRRAAQPGHVPGERRHDVPDQGRRLRRRQRPAQPARRERPAADLLRASRRRSSGPSTTTSSTAPPADDVIVAGDGDDTINGLGGNDRICGDAATTPSTAAPATTSCSVARLPTPSSARTATTPWSATPAAASNDDAGDTINGGTGNDFIDGWVGDDTLEGGRGQRPPAGRGRRRHRHLRRLAQLAVTANLTTNTATGDGNDTFVASRTWPGRPSTTRSSATPGPTCCSAGTATTCSTARTATTPVRWLRATT